MSIGDPLLPGQGPDSASRKPAQPKRRTRAGGPSSQSSAAKTQPDYTAFVEVAIASSSPQLLTYGWRSGSNAKHPTPGLDKPKGAKEPLQPELTLEGQEPGSQAPGGPQPGLFVLVNVSGKDRVGVVIRTVAKPEFACKPVVSTLCRAPALPASLLGLLFWVAQYYLCPLPRLIHVVAPGRIWKAERDASRWQRWQKIAGTGDDNTQAGPFKLLAGERLASPTGELRLSPDQLRAVASIVAPAREHDGAEVQLKPRFEPGFRTVLLEGVTGSGKTEVYLAAAKACREAGLTVLVLVPEIALTPQMTERFRAHFGSDLAVLHSGLTEAETEREWYRMALQDAGIVLGVRRGVFVPLSRIGLIVVDEEHDASYKTDEYPSVHARDVAIKRAQLEGAVCILGSASPSLESYANVKRGTYSHILLPRRARGLPPQIEIIDSKAFFTGLQRASSRRRRDAGGDRSSGINFVGPIIVPQIIAELSACQRRGEQSMVIVNRRGFANFALCLSCGHAQNCPNCEVTTTLHSGGTTEICHHCGYRAAARTSCGSCSSDRLETRGFGTQRVQAELAEVLPQLSTARLDRDVMTSPTRLADLLNGFRDGSFQCLIGTQILSKGHDFPRVSVVVVLHLEDALFLPDFRSAERTYQLLLQSAGRAGRAELPGRVLVQSLQHEHPVLAAVTSGQAARFYDGEMNLRRMAGLPPFARQVLFGLEHRDENTLSRDAFLLAQRLRDCCSANQTPGQDRRLSLVGPFPAPIERRGGLLRAQIVLTMSRELTPYRVVPPDLLGERFGSCRLRLDVDPHNFM